MTNDHKLKLSIIISAVIGLSDSVYLSWVKLSNTAAACLPGIGNCEKVNTSRFASVAGIPVALIGAAGYLTILLVVLLEGKIVFFEENNRFILFGLSLVGTLYSAYLTYVEVAVLKAICPFCVLSALAMTAIFIFAALRARISLAD